MMKSKLLETYYDIDAPEQNDQLQFLAGLEKIKQRLLIFLGSAIMFFILGMINTDMMEIDPIPFIWILLWVGGCAFGIYLLVSPKWRMLPLADRRHCAIGSLAISLFAFSYLPLYLFINQYEEAIPYGFLVVIIGLILVVTYQWLGKQSKSAAPGDEMFP